MAPHNAYLTATVVLLAVGCVDPHPAYELELLTGGATVAQWGGNPADAATLEVVVRVEPGADHGESRVELGRTSRFPGGVLRAYEPTDDGFVYHERKPLLAVPSTTAVEGRRTEGVAVAGEPRELRFIGQISNLELEPLCGDEIVLVPRLVISDVPDDDAEGAAAVRDIRLPVATEVVCD